MVEVSAKAVTQPPADEVCADKEVREQKAKILNRQTWVNKLSMVSGVIGMVGNPLWQSGLLGVAMGIATGTGAAAGMAFLGTAAGTALLIMAGIGAVFTLTSMAINYKMSKQYQNIGFDTMEIGADRSAKHLVKELQVNNMCMSNEHPDHCRGDGKSWTQVVVQPEAEQNRTIA